MSPPASPGAPTLVLGPILRHVDETSATVWVETSHPGEVRVLGAAAHTFRVQGHHFALVVVEGLAAGSETEYAVHLDGRTVWPEAGDERPAPGIRTLSPHRDLDLVFGSCRVDRPNEPPFTDETDDDTGAVGPDALLALSLALQSGERSRPDLMLFLGDQVYTDSSPALDRPAHLENPAVERTTGRPAPHASRTSRSFDDYAAVYRSSWSEPEVRWLLATVPSAMIFDDHEVVDNWNVSASWRAETTAGAGWREQITSAYTAYWIYQHLGNLSPDALRADPLWQAVSGGPGGLAGLDAETALAAFAWDADSDADGGRASRWSHHRDLGGTRLVVTDTRSVRALRQGRRSLLSEAEWAVLDERLRGDCDHLLLATSIPLLLHPAQHHVEAWNEALSEGVLGRRAQGWSERLRRRSNIEQWSAFDGAFRRMTGILDEIATGRRGRAPASVLVLSGDVHHSYVAAVGSKHPAGRSPILQLVSSPLRGELPRVVRRALTLARFWPTRGLTRLLAFTARVPRSPSRWEVTTGPLFGNFLGTLTVRGRSARFRLDRAVLVDDRPRLDRVHEESIAD
jgi:hypothetical protein